MRAFHSLPFLFASTLALSIPKRQAQDDGLRLIEYIQTFHTTDNEPLSLLPLINETSITHVNLAALHINSSPGDITLNDDSPNSTTFDQVWSDAAALQNAGIKVLFMMGGSAAGSYPRLCGSDVPATVQEDYYGPLLSTIKYHNIDGMDLDIEEDVDITCAEVLLNRFKTDMGSDFILSMAPVASGLEPDGSNLSGFDYVTLDTNAVDSNGNKLVNYYNGQFYNGWGDASSTTNYEEIITSGGWDPSRISLGVLDNSVDGGSGYVDIDELQEVIRNLTEKYSNFGGVTGWEYWDSGEADGLTEPWMWVQDVGDALYNGSSDSSLHVASSKKKRFTGLTEVPYPSAHQALTASGVAHMDAVYALNRTSGSLPDAKNLLNLSS